MAFLLIKFSNYLKYLDTKKMLKALLPFITLEGMANLQLLWMVSAFANAFFSLFCQKIPFLCSYFLFKVFFVFGSNPGNLRKKIPPRGDH